MQFFEYFLPSIGANCLFTAQHFPISLIPNLLLFTDFWFSDTSTVFDKIHSDFTETSNSQQKQVIENRKHSWRFIIEMQEKLSFFLFFVYFLYSLFFETTQLQKKSVVVVALLKRKSSVRYSSDKFKFDLATVLSKIVPTFDLNRT